MNIDPTTHPPTYSEVGSTQNSATSSPRSSNVNESNREITFAHQTTNPIHQRVWNRIDTSARNLHNYIQANSVDTVAASMGLGAIGGAAIAHYAGISELQDFLSLTVMGAFVGGATLSAFVFCMEQRQSQYTRSRHAEGTGLNDMELGRLPQVLSQYTASRQTEEEDMNSMAPGLMRPSANNV